MAAAYQLKAAVFWDNWLQFQDYKTSYNVLCGLTPIRSIKATCLFLERWHQSDYNARRQIYLIFVIIKDNSIHFVIYFIE